MKKSLITILFLSLLAISCTTTKQTSSTTKTMDIYGAGVIQYPMVGELDVDIDKVSAKTTVTGTNVDVGNAKVLAIKKAAEKADADILIEPVFEVTEEGSEVTVVAEGFPASYTGFRKVTKEDIPLLEAGQLQTAEVYEASAGKSSDAEDESVSSQDSNKLIYLGLLGAGLGAIFLSQN